MATIPGTAGDDPLIGTNDPDLIQAGAGNDTVDGGAGGDTLDGGTGSDVVNGDTGADVLLWGEDAGATGAHDEYHGGSGDDNYNPSVYSNQGGDTLSLGYGGTGAGGLDVTLSTPGIGTAEDAYGNTLSFDGIERIATGDGADRIDATNAVPTSGEGIRVFTGAGDDTVLAGSGSNYIHTGDGNDLVYGGDGYDLVETGAGNDTVYGGDGGDGIRWGEGNIDWNVGQDVYHGGSGYNTLNAWQTDSAGNGVRMVLNSSSSGTVDATGAATGHLDFQEFQNFLTGNGSDTVDGSAAGVNGFRTYTSWGNDSIIGSAGSDSIEGGWGADTVDGGAGNDFISMAGDLFSSGTAWVDDGSDLLVLRDGFGADTVRAFSIEAGTDQWGTPLPMDRLDVSGLHDADGNPIDLNDVTVGTYIDQWGNPQAQLTFPNGETLVLHGVDPADLTRAKLHELGIPCFCEGTQIATSQGDIAVEQLKVGDLVRTRDHGLRPIRWIGRRHLDSIDLVTAPHLRPIRISAGALAPNVPARDLLVSPQHRILVRSHIAQRMFGSHEVLIAAKQLLAINGIEQVAAETVTYFHILFDAHEIVLSNGAETESLYTGAQALKAVGPAARAEILALFPELRDTPAEAARCLVPGGRAQQLARRHARNGKDLIQAI
ncbi:Hint domain-containing protein [Paracoccus sp. (in: a-proteobacteria)]|uniref:Hint domain-containing protein n=1 Tax=Paracoccus sp. TaxID=267 RepID=UPI0035B3DE34